MATPQHASHRVFIKHLTSLETAVTDPEGHMNHVPKNQFDIKLAVIRMITCVFLLIGGDVFYYVFCYGYILNGFVYG